MRSGTNAQLRRQKRYNFTQYNIILFISCSSLRSLFSFLYWNSRCNVVTFQTIHLAVRRLRRNDGKSQTIFPTTFSAILAVVISLFSQYNY